MYRVTDRPRHGKAGIVRVLAPDTRWAKLLTGLRTTLTKFDASIGNYGVKSVNNICFVNFEFSKFCPTTSLDASLLNNSLSLFWIIRFVVLCSKRALELADLLGVVCEEHA